MISNKWVLLLSLISFSSFAMEPIGEEELSEVSGQNGVYLSGDLTLNEVGGPLASTDSGNIDPDGAGGPLTAVWGTCAEKEAGTVQRCGARLAVKTNSTEGYFVLDEMRGKMSFEGLTLRAREIDGVNDDFGGDEAAFDGKTVLEIGLPNEVRFEGFELTIANSSHERPTETNYNQQNIFGVEIDGAIEMQGNLLVFPVGNP